VIFVSFVVNSFHHEGHEDHKRPLTVPPSPALQIYVATRSSLPVILRRPCTIRSTVTVTAALAYL
jgi:hypothetical protein